MAYSPISSVPIQYSKADGTPANGYYIKFYLANSSTPISMQTDSGGATSLAKCKLNESGYPISNPNDENTVFIPHLSTTYTAYRFVLYASAADADANNVTAGLPNIQSVEINAATTLTDDLRADLAASSGASLLGFIQSGASALPRTAESKMRECFTPLDFGGVGDNSTNDTTALNSAVTNNKTFALASKFYNATPTLGASAPVFTGSVYGDGGGFTVRSGTYYRGTPGQIDTYAYLLNEGDGGTIQNTFFDGNGQATINAYQPAGQNVYFYPAVLQGNKKGQKAIANHIKNNGGHAVEGSNGSQMIIALNSAEGHNGIGGTNINAVTVIGNASENVSDSHVFLNTTDTTSAVGNVGRGAISGGGIDIAGGSNVAVVGNSWTGNKKHGMWALKSPNTADLYENILFSGNIAYNNCNYPDNDQGEIVIGDQAHLADSQGTAAAIVGNLVLPQDTPVASGYNAGVWIHPKADKTAVVSNVFGGFVSAVAPRAQAIRDKGSANAIYAGNVSFNAQAQVYIDAAGTGYVGYANNVNLRIAYDSPALPTFMESSDGKWDYHIVRPLTKAGITLMDISFPGGHVYDCIEVTVCNESTLNGIVQQRILARGDNSAVPTIYSNTTVFSAGANAPAVTVDISVANRLRIKANTNAAGTDNQPAAFYIKIISSADYISRFVPVFA